MFERVYCLPIREVWSDRTSIFFCADHPTPPLLSKSGFDERSGRRVGWRNVHPVFHFGIGHVERSSSHPSDRERPSHGDSFSIDGAAAMLPFLPAGSLARLIRISAVPNGLRSLLIRAIECRRRMPLAYVPVYCVRARCFSKAQPCLLSLCGRIDAFAFACASISSMSMNPPPPR